MNSLSNQIMYLVVFQLLGTILPIVMTFYLYWKVYKRTKGAGGENSKHLLWYSAIQIFCFVPGSLLDVIYMFLNIESLPFWAIEISSLCHRSWGFLNLLAYWFLRYADNEKDETKQEAEENNVSALYYSQDNSSLEAI